MSTENGWEEEPEFPTGDTGSVVDTVDPVDYGVVDTFAPAADLDLTVAPPLTFDEAKTLTEHIRATTDVLYVLIQRAHAGRAWEALGYNSFEAYVNTEFSISRSRAYQLLNQAKVVEEIVAAAPEGTRIAISEAAARDLKSLVSEITPEIAEATKDLSPEDAGLAIEDMIREYRDRKNSDADVSEGGESYDEELAADQADRDGFSSNGSGSYGGGDYPQNGPVDTSDGGGADDEDLDALLQFDEDPRETRQKFESVYNFYSSLSALKEMPSVEKMISWIPVERRVQVSASLPSTLAWLTEFHRQWNEQPWAASEEVEEEVSVEDFESDAEEDFDFDSAGEDIFADSEFGNND